ncbi:methyltransferase family protein [Nocardia sp. N13]|uniref:methyltransferase family protein n=1 Tax=Nocardioides sp. N13(2025) TaxID=3453405 RepID=UPI003F75D862
MGGASGDTVAFRLWPPVAPLYVGLLLLYLAPSLWALVLFPAAVLLVWWGAIRPEERFLHERFGEPYDAYRRRVRRWL